MNPELGNIPDPSDDDLYLLTAEEYLVAVGQETADPVRSHAVARRDLQSEIDGLEDQIDELVEEFNMHPSDELAEAIEAAKLNLGKALVDRLNQPPA